MKNILMITLVMVVASLHCSVPRLDELALKYNTDKNSHYHNYTKIYEKYFDSVRQEALKFLEIGFSWGASAHMWQDYFPNATLYFLDIDATCFDRYGKGLSDRVKCYRVDQSSEKQLLDFVGTVGGDLDVIIDDGGHTMVQQITSFKTLFPYLKVGGIYVIEDLHTSYWRQWGGGGSQENPFSGEGTTVHFLAELIDDLNYAGASTGLADTQKCPDYKFKNYYQRHIEAMHFYNSICFVFKR